MNKALVISAFLLVPVLAGAQESVAPAQPETDCKLLAQDEKTGKMLWLCPVPPRPVTCTYFASDLQVCSGSLKKGEWPANYRWRKGNWERF